jgi:hypothetical protein
MKRSKDMNKILKKGLLVGALTLAAGAAGAVEDIYLAAKAYNKVLPDGSGVPMWGYVADPGGVCYGTTPIADRRTCVNALPDPVVPGPRLTVPVGEPNVRIWLTNMLPEATSIVITGQEMPWSDADNGPTWDDGTTGSRMSATQRVRSFGREANPNGGRQRYVWNNFRQNPMVKTGSFIYHSGTLPQKQVYMGLHGAITKDAAAGEVYPGVAYDQEQVLFYSEIDPDLNAAIAAGSLETAIHYHARWFLINGEPYSEACTDDGGGNDVASGYPCANMAQTGDLPVITAKSPTLLRFFSATGETHVPTLQGMHMTIHAEDGVQYTYQNGDVVAGTAPREQYSIMMPPLKTKDAIIEPQLAGRYAIYDGNGYMTNPTDPEDFDHGDPIGGMLRFLEVSDAGNVAPVAVADVAAAVEGRTITIAVLANDTDAEGAPLAIASADAISVEGGAVTCDLGTPGGTCDYTAPLGLAVDDSFTYDVTDGTTTTTGGIVTVSLSLNAPPVANADTTAGNVDSDIVIAVLGNDSDGNGDALTVVSTSDPAAVINPDGTVTYSNAAAGVYTFDYDAEDPSGAIATGTVTVTVSEVGNSAPVAADDAYSVGESSILNGNVLDNDSDANGDALTARLLTGPNPADTAAFTLNGDGSFSFQSVANFTGQVTFTYVANDIAADSNVATATITVEPVNDIPAANDDVFYLTSMTTTSVAAPGVLANDTDADGDTLSAINGVASAGTLVLNADGSFDYTPQAGDQNLTLGTVATFSYQASDGPAVDDATVSLERTLVVRQAVCERRPNGRCDWNIQGSKSNTGTVRVRAFDSVTGQIIGTTRESGTNWTIEVGNSRFDPAAIDVRVLGGANSNAVIQDYATTIVN